MKKKSITKRIILQLVVLTAGFVLIALLLVSAGNGQFLQDPGAEHANAVERGFQIAVAVYMLLLDAMLWAGYASWYKRRRYSYQVIFLSGFAMWIGVSAIFVVIDAAMGYPMPRFFSFLQEAGWIFMVFTAWLVLFFAIALTTSNIALIRHEGFRKKNLYGITISLLMVAGEIGGAALMISSSGNTRYHKNSILASSFLSCYVLLECFLIGAIINGILSARHEPALDVDYLIILGCKVRKDGTLYPLIRGRVDRALAFNRKQKEATGKEVIFVPSGGQGEDDQLSEAEAMKRYLMEQGIPESQILPEAASRNTLENMQFSRKLIEERNPDAKVAFSTTNYHVFRSGIISRQAGFAPEGMGARTKWYFWPNAFVREIFGMLVYKSKTLLLMLMLMIAFFALIGTLIR